jgi:hypothetical protein
MKKVLPIVVFLLLGMIAFSTVPEAIKYQAVVRDNNGNVLVNSSISVRLSILKTSIAGAAVYVETHNILTNALGMINLEIGHGTPVSGTLSGIEWGGDSYFIKIEMDENGGSNYTLIGTSQLVSVPYSLYAKEAGNGTQWSDTTNNIYYTSGKVAIGSSNPQALLQVNNSSRIGHNVLITGETPTIRMSDTALTGNGVIIGIAGESNDLISGSEKGDVVFTNEAYGTGGGYIFGTRVPSQACVKITNDCKVGFGTDQPVSKVDVKGGDINIEDIGSGVIMKSPDGQCWRLTVSNAGAPVFTSIACLTSVMPEDTVKCFGARACYAFRGNADDSSGNAFNASVNGATLALGHKGTANSAYHFADAAQYIDLPNFNTILNNTEEFSISVWTKAETEQSNTVFALNPDVPTDRIVAHLNYYTSPGITKVVFDVGNFSTGRHELLNQPFTTAWEHYVFVASQSQNSVKVYRNNVLIINQTGYIVANKAKALRIAAPFYGYIDDFKIFNRALSAGEVSTIYNAEK